MAKLEEEHSGQELVDAVVSFADTLEPEDRELLQDVLLARAKDDFQFMIAIDRRRR